MKKFKKILAGTLVSMVSVTAIGCASNTNKLAKNIDKSMADFVSSINNLDYVDTTKSSSEKIGKIVETNAIIPFNNNNFEKKDKKRAITSTGNTISFLNNNISEVEIENTITRPSDRSGDFDLFVLSDIPFVTMTSDDSSADFSICVKFSTNKIEQASTEIDTKINTLILKRSILMIYVNEIYNNKVNLTDESKVAINAYVNVLKENTSFLNGNRGMVKNQLGLASDLAKSEKNNDLVNYYIIKSGEALENRVSKLDTSISAIDSIIQIIENNLAPSSTYYSNKLSSTYNDIINNINASEKSDNDINASSTNKEIADKISSSLNFTKEQISNSLTNQKEVVLDNKNPSNKTKQIDFKNENNANQVIRNISTKTNEANSTKIANEQNKNDIINNQNKTNLQNDFHNRSNPEINGQKIDNSKATDLNNQNFVNGTNNSLNNRNNFNQQTSIQNDYKQRQAEIERARRIEELNKITNQTKTSSNEVKIDNKNISTNQNDYVSSQENDKINNRTSNGQNNPNREYIANQNSNLINNRLNNQNKRTIRFPKRMPKTNEANSQNLTKSEKNANQDNFSSEFNPNSLNNDKNYQNTNFNNNQNINSRKFIPKQITLNTQTNGTNFQENKDQQEKQFSINQDNEKIKNDNENNDNHIIKRVSPNNVYRPTYIQEKPFSNNRISSIIVPAENKAVRVPYKTNNNFKVK